MINLFEIYLELLENDTHSLYDFYSCSKYKIMQYLLILYLAKNNCLFSSYLYFKQNKFKLHGIMSKYESKR